MKTQGKSLLKQKILTFQSFFVFCFHTCLVLPIHEVIFIFKLKLYNALILYKLICKERPLDGIGSMHVSFFWVSLYINSKITWLRQKDYYYICMIGNPPILCWMLLIMIINPQKWLVEAVKPYPALPAAQLAVFLSLYIVFLTNSFGHSESQWLHPNVSHFLNVYMM